MENALRQYLLGQSMGGAALAVFFALGHFFLLAASGGRGGFSRPFYRDNMLMYRLTAKAVAPTWVAER